MLFSHQREIAIALANHFNRTFVIAADAEVSATPSNITVVSTSWVEGKTLSNLYRLYRKSLPLLWKNRSRAIVLFHMTDFQAFLMTAFCRLIHIRSYLWYAHKTSSLYLRISQIFVDKIFTSTQGSCPLTGPKVKVIGQAIKMNYSDAKNSLPGFPPLQWYHIGRLDPSKNIPKIIQVLERMRNKFPQISFHVYGESSSESTRGYAEDLLKTFSTDRYKNWVEFCGALNHSDLEKISVKYDGFIHAYEGSLDKTLVEATLLKRAVISANSEFAREFEDDYHGSENVEIVLTEKINKLMECSYEDFISKIENNFLKSVSEHTMDSWVRKILHEMEVE